MKKWIHVVITVLLMFFFRFVPAPEPITAYGMQILGVFLGVIYGWSFCGLIWPSFLGMLALGLTDFGTVANVYAAGFGQENLILMLLAFLFAGPLLQEGVADYLGMKLITFKFVKGKPWLFFFIIFVGCGILSLLVNGMIIIIFMLLLFANLFKKLGYQKGDRTVAMFNAGVVLGVAVGMSVLPFMGWAIGPLGVAAASGITVDMTNWVICMLLFLVSVALLHVLIMKLMRCNVKPLVDVDLAALDSEGVLGKGLSKYQKALLSAAIFNCVLCIAVSFLSGPEGWRLLIMKCGVYGIFLLTLTLMILIEVDGKKLLNVPEAAKAISWDLIFLYAIAMILSSALTAETTGVAAFVLKILTPILAMTSEYTFILLVVVVTLVLTNIANNMVVTFTMLSVVVMLYQQGVVFNAPLTVLCIATTGLIGLVLPASSVYGALLHSNEMNTTASAVQSGILTCVAVILSMAILVIPVGLMLF